MTSDRPMTNSEAVEQLVTSLVEMGRVDTADLPVVVAAATLARQLDAAWHDTPGLAALWKQYREAVADLRGLNGGDNDDALAALMREFSAQVGDTPQA